MVDLFSIESFYLLLGGFTIMGFWMVLYKNCPWNKIVENLLVGGAAANILVLGIPGIVNQWNLLVQGKYDLIIPMVLGVLLFTVNFGRKYSYYAHLGSAVLVGVGSGSALKDGIWTSGALQIGGAIQSSLMGKDIVTTIFNIFAFSITLTSLLYFTFTVEQKGIYGKVTRYGRFTLMGAFGVFLGTNFVSRSTAIITTINPFLTTGWGPLVTAAAAIYIAADTIYGKTKAVKKVPAT